MDPRSLGQSVDWNFESAWQTEQWKVIQLPLTFIWKVWSNILKSSRFATLPSTSDSPLLLWKNYLRYLKKIDLDMLFFERTSIISSDAIATVAYRCAQWRKLYKRLWWLRKVRGTSCEGLSVSHDHQNNYESIPCINWHWEMSHFINAFVASFSSTV